MYTPEELKTLVLLMGAAIIGRLLFYRNLSLDKKLKERVKIRCLQLLWELPVIIAIAFASLEMAAYFKLPDRAGVVIGIAMGYVGMDTIKFLLEDYIRQKFSRSEVRYGKGKGSDSSSDSSKR